MYGIRKIILGLNDADQKYVNNYQDIIKLGK